MLQWCFEAVNSTQYFPMGVKVTYRPFSADRAIVFEFKNKNECLHPVGMATGMEPVTLYNTWRPTGQDDPMRPGIEGFFLLRNMPHRVEDLPPVAFPPDCCDEIRKTLPEINKINKTYEASNDRVIREEWNRWAEKFAPRSSSSSDYIQQLRQEKVR
jgi:hypothetical protein